ncbi:MAG: TIGR03032 family protein [Chryseosolibacter sp.]
MNPKVAAFTCTHSPNLPGLLHQLQCTLALSTYQAGKVVLLSAVSPSRLIQLPRSFQKPMGIAVDATKLAVATMTEVIVFNNASRMAANYPQQPNTYDALFLPRATYFTGEVDIHDLHWTGENLLAVNTRFSCLAAIDHRYSFTPLWKPFFIPKITPEDHCHLNGVAFENGTPKYVTALGKTNVPQGWRQNRENGGIVMEVSSNTIIAEGLSMPHSPRIYNNQLYVLESASGNLVYIDPASGKKEVVVSLNGFARGMDLAGDYLFIGLSQLRKRNSAVFDDLPIAGKSVFCGIVVVHLPTARIVAEMKYEDSVEEIYDVRIMHDMKRPGLVSSQKPEHRLALTTPEEDYWAVLKKEEHDERGHSSIA